MRATCFVFFVFVSSSVLSQRADSLTQLKNYYSFCLAGANYQPSYASWFGKGGYDSYSYSSFSLEGYFNYRRMISTRFSILTGIEWTQRYQINPNDTLKIKLTENFLQIPVALGGSFKDILPGEFDLDIGPYISVLMDQRILHPDNYSLPSYLKESYSPFSYFKWGAFAQFTGIFYIRNHENPKSRFGIFWGLRLFGELSSSTFGKSSDIFYTPSYTGMSYFFGGVIRY